MVGPRRRELILRLFMVVYAANDTQDEDKELGNVYLHKDVRLTAHNALLLSPHIYTAIF